MSDLLIALVATGVLLAMADAVGVYLIFKLGRESDTVKIFMMFYIVIVIMFLSTLSIGLFRVGEYLALTYL